MASEHPSRREVLKATTALSATASLGVARGRAQDRSATPLGRIDAVLRAATDAKDVPGLALHVDRREGPRAVRPPGDFHCGWPVHGLVSPHHWRSSQLALEPTH